MTSLVTVTEENHRSFLDPLIEIERLSFSSPWGLDALKAEIENPFSNLWILLLDRILSGYICFWMLPAEIQLLSLAVHPWCRRRGVGTALMTHMIEMGAGKGVQHVWLEVRPSNLAAKRLYERLGFEVVYRRPRYYPDDHEDALVMSLDPSKHQKDKALSN